MDFIIFNKTMHLYKNTSTIYNKGYWENMIENTLINNQE